MSDSPNVAAFTGGELHILPGTSKSRDVVLAVPLSRLLVKFVNVPPGSDESPEQLAAPALKELSPFPDEAITVACETMHEAEDGGKVVLAAALPESAAEDIGEKLDEAKLNVVRIDALPLGMMRALLPRIGDVIEPESRVVYLEMTPDGVSAVVFDGSEPVAMRSFSADGALKYELMLCLMAAEDFAGPKPVKAIVASGMDASSLSDLAPVKDVEGVSVDEALEGVAARTLEPGALNALPESWREVLYETRFKAKLVRRLVAAGVVWLLAMSVLFGVPAVYGFMTDHQAALIKEHRRSYAAVSEMRDKVKVIRKYSDHAGGALESMRIVSEMMPDEGDGFVLTSWDFRRNEGMKVAGEADEKSMIYIFKNNLSGCGAFTSVGSPSIKQTKERYAFTIDLSFVEQEDAP